MRTRLQYKKYKKWSESNALAITRIVVLLIMATLSFANAFVFHNPVITLICITVNEVILIELLSKFIVNYHNDLVDLRFKKKIRELKEKGIL